MDNKQVIQKFQEKIDWAKQNRYPYVSESDVELYKMAIDALAVPSVEPQVEQWKDFVLWVATEIFDDMWEYNKDAFAEIACRKLAELGIVRAKGDEWELVVPQERSE